MNGINGKKICAIILISKYYCRLIPPAFHWARVPSHTKYGIAVITLLYGQIKNTKCSILIWAITILIMKTRQIKNCLFNLQTIFRINLSLMEYCGLAVEIKEINNCLTF